MDLDRVERISQEVFRLLGTGRQVPLFSQRFAGFDVREAYAVAERVCQLRESSGEKPVGRKIGFTNRAVWRGLGISAPIWNYVFNRTVADSAGTMIELTLGDMPEPRIEPEIILHLAREPELGMSESELYACLDWFAAGYEIVYSIFPDWHFSAADAVAAFGVHGSLVIGSKRLTDEAGNGLMEELSGFKVELKNQKGDAYRGSAHDVLGGPLQALNYLVSEIARHPGCKPLSAGELVTTGTLTEARPAFAGETWTASFAGIDLQPLTLRFG